MTKKASPTRKGKVKKLRLKKETISDLDAKGRGGVVKGGGPIPIPYPNTPGTGFTYCQQVTCATVGCPLANR